MVFPRWALQTNQPVRVPLTTNLSPTGLP